MPKGVKTDNKKIAEIITSFALTNSYSKTAKEVGVSNNTVKRVILNQQKENPEELAKVVNEKKELFQEKANSIIDKALELLDRRYDTALENQDKLEELIGIVFEYEEPDSTKRMTYKEKVEIAKKLARLELNSLSEITTSMGTLYDKMRLAKGESTNNDSITIKMSDELKDLSK